MILNIDTFLKLERTKIKIYQWKWTFPCWRHFQIFFKCSHVWPFIVMFCSRPESVKIHISARSSIHHHAYHRVCQFHCAARVTKFMRSLFMLTASFRLCPRWETPKFHSDNTIKLKAFKFQFNSSRNAYMADNEFWIYDAVAVRFLEWSLTCVSFIVSMQDYLEITTVIK